MKSNGLFPAGIGWAQRWLVGALLLLMLATPVLSAAQANGPEAPVVEATVPVEEPAPPVDEGVQPPPVETPIPEVPATQPPVTEPVPTEGGAIPTATLETEPSVTPDQATVEPTLYGPVSMLATNGSCVLVSGTETIGAGEVVAMRCQSTLEGDWTFVVDGIAGGWLWAFRYGESSSVPSSDEVAAWGLAADATIATRQGWSPATGPFGAPVTVDTAGDARVVEFFLTPTETAPANTSADLRITLEPFVDEAGLDEQARISPMMVVADGPSGCVQLSATDVVSYPAAGTRDYVMYKCTWPGTEWQLRIDGITASGWEWAAISGQLAPAQIEANPPTIATISGWSSGAPTWVTGFAANAPACPFASLARASGTNAGNDLNAYYIFLKPREGGRPGTHGDLTIRQIPSSVGPVCIGEAPNPAGSRTSTLTGILAGTTPLSCVKVSPAGSTVTPPDYFRFRCDRGPAHNTQFFIDRIAPGWTWRVLVSIGGQITTVKTGTAPDVFTGSQRPWNAEGTAWYVDLIPTTSAPAGSEGYVFVRVTGNNPNVDAVTSRLSGSRSGGTTTPVTVNDVQFSCSTATVQSLVASPVTVTCTWAARASIGERQVTLDRITIPAPAGWTPSTSAANATVQGGVLTIAPGVTISAQASYTFAFTLLPSCSASTAATLTTLTSRFQTTTGLLDGPAVNLSAARLGGSMAVTMIGTQTSLDWNLDYQFAARPVEGTLGYRVVANRCGGWSIQVQASPFTYTGPHGSTGIPAANVTVASTHAPVPVVGTVTGITVPPTTGSTLANPITILTAVPGAGVGTYDNQLGLRVTIPAFAAPGTYRSTITITSAVGP